MAATLGTTIVIGAALAGGFRAAIGNAVAGLGEMDRAAGGLGQTLADVGSAWVSMNAFRSASTQAAELERSLMQAGITADLSRDQVARLEQHLRRLAVPEQTNQSVSELLKGYTALVSAGMTNDKAQASLYALGRTATAASADIEDLSKTAFVLVDTLGVSPGDLSAELDRLAFAGKQGAFELKDMARYFPTLGAAAKGLGLQGSEAVATLGAALQIAKKGAADPSEAANNMKNFLAKATAPETVKRFKEHGVNLKKVLSTAMKNGENPMEALLVQIQKMTKGDPFKLSRLFGDQQVLDFLKPMLANMEEYKRLKKDIATSKGTVDTDFDRMMETATEKAKAFRAAAEKLAQSVGKALLPAFSAVVDIATPLVGWLADAADAAPTTTLAIAGLTAGVTVLAPAFRVATVGARLLFAALAANPVGLIVGGLAIGAALIIDNWSAVKGFFVDLWADPAGSARRAAGWIGGHIIAAADWIKGKWATVKSYFVTLWGEAGANIPDLLGQTGPIGQASASLIDNWSAVKGFFTDLWNDPMTAMAAFKSWVSAEATAAADVLRKAWNDPKAFLLGMWDDVLAKWDSAVAYVLGLWDKVSSPLDTVAGWMGWNEKAQPAETAKPASQDRKPGDGFAQAQENGRAALTPKSKPSAASSAAAEGPPGAVSKSPATTTPASPAPGAVSKSPPVATPAGPAPATAAGIAEAAAALAAAVQAAIAGTTGKVEVLLDFRGMPQGTSAQSKSSSPAVAVSQRLRPAEVN